MKYLLDTCIVEALLKAEPGHENIRDRIAAAPQSSLAISALTAVEIWTGITGARQSRGFEGLGQAVGLAALGEPQAGVKKARGPRICQYICIDILPGPAYACWMPAAAKSGQIQIRVSPAQKAAIRRAARRAGLDMSAYVLARLLSAPARRFHDLTEACAESRDARFALAELNSWLASLGAGELQEAVSSPPSRLTPYLANYVAAMVEHACAKHGVAPPSWTRATAPLAEPVFGSALMSLRLYLLTHSPAPFRRRNIFIDASVGSRV